MSKPSKKLRQLPQKQKAVEHRNAKQDIDDRSSDLMDHSTRSYANPTNGVLKTKKRARDGARRKVEFVFPRAQDGKIRPFVFGKHDLELTEEASDTKEKEETSRVDASLNEATSQSKSNETIDDILFPQKKVQKKEIRKSVQSVERSTKAESSQQQDTGVERNTHIQSTKNKSHISRQHDVSETSSSDSDDLQSTMTCFGGEPSGHQDTPTHATESVDKQFVEESTKRETSQHAKMPKKFFTADEPTDQHIPGKLSGLSVEDAVRDKFGCRPRANSTDGELNLPRRGLCDERMVLEAHRWNLDRGSVMQVSPRGFVNLGNTCFLNSTLQCLAYLPPFCQSLIAMPECSSPRKNGKNQKTSQGKRITLIIRTLFRKVHGEEKGAGAIEPRAIVKAIPTVGMCGSRNGYKFRPGRQEDAHEFLVHLLDAMNDGELREAGINQHSSGWRDRLPVPRLDETTFIHRIFGGYLRSQIHCSKCGYRSNTYDPFLDLALEISKNSCSSVAAAFNEFTRKETLDSQNRWKCSGCGKHVCATKQLTVFRPPLSLCIQLKRFAFIGGGGSPSFGGGYYHHNHRREFGHRHGGTKITKPIEFPAEMKLPLSDSRSCEYTLTGIVIHVGGSSSSGHYTAYVKRPGKSFGSNQWYHLDDSFVEPVSEKTVLRQKDAYLLFYCRKEVKLEFPSPPRSMSAEQAIELSRARSKALELSDKMDRDKRDKVSAVNSKASSKRVSDALSASERNTQSTGLVYDNLLTSISERPTQSAAATLDYKFDNERNKESAVTKHEDRISMSERTLQSQAKRQADRLSASERTTQSAAKRLVDTSANSERTKEYGMKGLVDTPGGLSNSERTKVTSNRSRANLSTSETPTDYPGTMSISERSAQVGKRPTDRLSQSERPTNKMATLGLGDRDIQSVVKRQAQFFDGRRAKALSNVPSQDNRRRIPTAKRIAGSTTSGSEEDLDEILGVLAKGPRLTLTEGTKSEAGDADAVKSISSQATNKKETPSLPMSPPSLELSKPVPSNDSRSPDSDSSSSESGPGLKDIKDDPLLVGKKQSKGSVAKEKSSKETYKSAKETERRNPNTRIVLDGDGSRASVSVMVGPRHKSKAWNPKTTVSSKGVPGFDLLGNQSIGKWDNDDDADKSKSESTSALQSRSKLIKELEKEASDKKRKMRLDRWDSVLDEGKKKKIKKHDGRETDVCSAPDENVFQRIQSGIQRMSRGNRVNGGKVKRSKSGKVKRVGSGNAKRFFRRKPGQKPRRFSSGSEASKYSC